MAEVYEIEFKGGRKEFFSNSQGISLRIGDFAVVQADQGEDIGKVAQIGQSVTGKKGGKRKILRKATNEDMLTLKENSQKEKDAFEVCKAKIAEHGLDMKLIDVEYQFDSSKVCFFFTAEERVDFRELVKDLAAIYRTRIELRQIGARDEARRLSGYGLCGRRLCCDTFLTEFEPISSQMARDQDLVASSTKTSGVCGRLMCCLLFEEDFYKEALKRFPKIGTKVSTDNGEFEVSKADIFHNCVYLKDEAGNELKMALEEVNELRRPLRRLFGARKAKSKEERP